MALLDSTGAVGLDIRISIMHVPEYLREALIGLRVGHKVTVTGEMLRHHFSALLGVGFGAYTTNPVGIWVSRKAEQVVFTDTLLSFHIYPDALIDEFQDTNLVQYNIAKKLAAYHQNICMVGDDKRVALGIPQCLVTLLIDSEEELKALPNLYPKGV